ncbi:hypothetical protein LEMLEM_LOCUS3593 [Lemmus lemmus]
MTGGDKGAERSHQRPWQDLTLIREFFAELHAASEYDSLSSCPECQSRRLWSLYWTSSRNPIPAGHSPAGGFAVYLDSAKKKRR